MTEEFLKQRLAVRGVRVPPGQTLTVADELGPSDLTSAGPVVVKALVPVTDRARQGLVTKVDGLPAARAAAARMLATTVEGIPVRRVLVESVAPDGLEYYLAASFDHARGEAVLLFGPGGSGIEQREQPPERIPLILSGQKRTRVEELAQLPAPLRPVAAALVAEFRALRATLIELNPVRLCPDGAVVLDAKASLDPSAPPAPDAVTWGVEDPHERALRELADSLPGGTGVRFGRLSGTVGMVSAGGGVLAVVHDALRRHGLQPANFADVSGGPATVELLGAVAREVLTLEPEAILVVTGIASSISVTRFAETVVEALAPLREREDGPVIVARMAGPEEEEAASIMSALPGCTTVGRDVPVDEAVEILAARMAERGFRGHLA